uniref:Uncharacterized protein n=1 Tax=Romanomermis culicivorax TaxID=13658 RepID=A0A915IDC9_ROMCU
MEYPEALQDQIQQIMFPRSIPTPPPCSQFKWLILLQLLVKWLQLSPKAQLLLTIPLDVQSPQVPTTSVPTLNGHGQPIRKPSQYKHLTKQKTQQQEEVAHCKAHKT